MMMKKESPILAATHLLSRRRTDPAQNARRWLSPCIGLVLLLIIGCAGGERVHDPIATLSRTDSTPRQHVAAMRMMDERDPKDGEYLTQLHRMIWVPGYTVRTREQALERLKALDPDGLQRTIRQRLPRMTMWGWLNRLCDIIAEHHWTDLSSALVNSWAQPIPLLMDDAERPEYRALVTMHGEEMIPDLLFDMLLESNTVAQQGLRTRCWEMLHRLGHRDRLIQLITERDVPDDDAMLLDLQAGARDLGIVPHNREEILWMRELRRPERASFWSEAREAVQALPRERREALELRDVAITVTAYRHEPSLLTRPDAAIYAQLAGYLQAQRHHMSSSNFGGVRGGRTERLSAYRDRLTWGDLAAMLMAVRAFEVPQMVDHLFEYAERDMADDTTEYGGIIQLDEQGRFEIIEFPPRIREHGNKFIAPQAMFDAGYTALFHFHNHAQRHSNRDYASPGLGDLTYAENTRANCLVFTFINRDTLNMDYYRHGRVVVDLGEIRRRR